MHLRVVTPKGQKVDIAVTQKRIDDAQITLLDRGKRLDNLARLARSAERRSLRGRPVLTRTDLVRLLRAYAGEADWRPWVEGVAGRRRQSRWRHQLGWWLERVVGADPARRDGSARID